VLELDEELALDAGSFLVDDSLLVLVDDELSEPEVVLEDPPRLSFL
jgi:hypothetical protein